MNTIYPAIRGRFGSTDYFLILMPVGDLVDKIHFPEDQPGWNSEDIEERFQRKINKGRIRREIAPYFATDTRRFSGSLVLAIMDGKSVTVEPMRRVLNRDCGIPKLYDPVVDQMRFLIMSDEARLVPLDGQHRAKAFKLAITGDGDDGTARQPIPPNPALAADRVAVILVRFEESTSRYIFNKINKYARPTGKVDKLITDDDNAVAVIAKRLIGDGVVPLRLVNTDTSSLNRSTHEFTTISTFYDSCMEILSGLELPSVKNPEKMGEAERDMRLDEIGAEWRRLTSGIGLWKKALRDPSAKGDDTRKKIRRDTLLGKPIGQLSLVGGYALACRRHVGDPDRDELVRRLDGIDWRVASGMWSGVLINQNGRVMSGRSVSRNAARFIAHLIGANLTKEEKQAVLEKIHGERWKRHTLPRQVAGSLLPPPPKGKKRARKRRARPRGRKRGGRA